MIEIVICEDNPIHTKKIQEQIESNIDEPFRIRSFSSAVDFRKGLLSPGLACDILFMDIELGAVSGITLAQEVNARHPGIQIIFISQYLEYVSDVYETDHIFFIHKSYADTYLPIALEKALNKIHTLNTISLRFHWHKENFEILQKDILYMERILRITEIHTNNQIYTTSEKLTELITRLDHSFIITHRSFLINLHSVVSFGKESAYLSSGMTIPISRSRYHEVKKRLTLLFS